jgi:hypothetical protein
VPPGAKKVSERVPPNARPQSARLGMPIATALNAIYDDGEFGSG